MVAQAAAVVAKLPPELRFLKAASSSRPRLALSTAPALLREPLGMVLVRLGRSHGGEIWSQALGVELEWEQLQLRRTRTAFFTSFMVSLFQYLSGIYWPGRPMRGEAGGKSEYIYLPTF